MIRKYQEKDLEELLDVWFQASSLAHPFLDPAFMENEKKNIREIYIPNTITWVYEFENKVIGFIAMMENEVGAIFLKPNHHGSGIGTKLMNHVTQFHQELEVEVFEKNEIGRRFYDRYGFKFMKKHIHEETGFDLLRLKYVCNVN